MAEYIERENLIDYLTRATGHKATCDGCCDIDCVDCIRDEVIKNLPTADVVEVRHGEWKLYWDDNYLSWSHKCSECGKFPLCKEETMHDEVLSNYCPNCGAKMNGKDDNDG